MRRIALIAISCALVAGACGGAKATNTPVPTATPAPTAAPTIAPTIAPTDTPEPTAVADATLPAGWTLFTPDNGSFSVGFPGKPATSTTSQDNPLGTVEINAYSVAKGSATYIVTQERFPAGTISNFTEADVQLFLGTVVSSLATASKGTASNETDVTAAGYPAKAATITIGKDAEDILVFMFANDTYVLIVKHPVAVTVDSAAFFDTFQLP